MSRLSYLALGRSPRPAIYWLQTLCTGLNFRINQHVCINETPSEAVSFGDNRTIRHVFNWAADKRGIFTIDLLPQNLNKF